jgi:hypothetical protein
MPMMDAVSASEMSSQFIPDYAVQHSLPGELEISPCIDLLLGKPVVYVMTSSFLMITRALKKPYFCSFEICIVH